MAIIIPSKKTYERQNPKVRDNVIERIEVGAKVVSTSAEYETQVEEKNATEKQVVVSKSVTNRAEGNTINRTTNETGKVLLVANTYFELHEAVIQELKVKKNKNNKYIKKVFTGNKEDGTDWVGISLTLEKTVYNYTTTYSPYEDKVYHSFEGYTKFAEPVRNFSFEYSFYNEKKSYDTQNNQYLVRTISDDNFSKGAYYAKTQVFGRMYNWVTDYNAVSEFEGNYNMLSYEFDDTDEEYYIFKNIKFCCEATIANVGNWIESTSSILQSNNRYPLIGLLSKIVPLSMSVTIYGDTIGIDLTDNTVYIPEADKTSKKVQSIDGNELMQTSNYWAETGENAIERAFSATQQEYANGKETATLRCSIGEYYGDKEFSVRFGSELSSYEDTAVYELFVSGDQKLAEGDIVYFKNHAVVITEVDEDYYAVVGRKDILSMYKWQSVVAKQLKISTKEKGVPMLFSEYDQVIPMKLGADGKDHPMSVYRDGTPKVFNVLSVHPYFDGAVWQELELQEIMKKV